MSGISFTPPLSSSSFSSPFRSLEVVFGERRAEQVEKGEGGPGKGARRPRKGVGPPGEGARRPRTKRESG